MTYVLALLATGCGIFASVMLLTLLLAGSPNSKPEQLAQIKAWMLTILIVTLLSVAAAACLMVFGRPWHAVGVGSFPIAFNAVAFVIMLRTLA
jgi:hypothetical protein